MKSLLKKITTAALVAASVIAIISPVIPAYGMPSLGLQADLVSEKAEPGSFPLLADKQSAPIFLDPADWSGVLRAGADLQADVQRVTGVKPMMDTNGLPQGKIAVIIGTLGKSPLIDSLAKARKINGGAISGKWESFMIATVANPLPGLDRALVIAGSDKRGTIYGIYEISEQIGVSPWYWWADVPAQHHTQLFIKAGTYVQGPPVVKYRGIFINDEDPCLGGWSREKFGGLNSKMYTHMFELLLRLRANYLWPAMWGKAFNEDDAENPRLADEYGIVMGTSHHEPMIRAQKEWTKHRQQYGNGEWNYLTNEGGLKKFWSEGIERNKSYESIVTVGMRGDGDEAMPDAGGFDANKKLLEKIIADQRQILSEHLNPDVAKVPQLWALKTEVQGYYDAGLKLPDDITLLFSDDNDGNLRRVPTAHDRQRSGGAGIYFHEDMCNLIYSYMWVNSSPLPKVWEQMNLAVQNGATRIWIVNVGDLKPLEVPLEFFLRMAWDPESVSKDKIADYQLRWAEREFGKEHAVEIADIVAKYAKYNNWRKPERLKPDTFSLINYREADRVSQLWNDLRTRAEKLNEVLPPEERDAFYELALHSVEACANLTEMYIAAGRNQLFTRQGRASANAEAALVRELFKKDQDISHFYNSVLAGGKWHHMMDQPHIGYTKQVPKKNISPEVTELKLPETAAFGVAVEGSTEAWPGSINEAVLPPFDSLNRQRSYLEVFERGTKPIKFKSVADQPWIILTEANAPGAGADRRLWVDIDWNKAPVGQTQGTITISGTGNPVSVKLTATKATAEQEREALGCFGGLIGPITFLAADAKENVPVGNLRWENIPDYGRGPSAMEVFPVTAAPIQPPNPAPRLEYPVYFARTGKYEVQLVTSPTLDTVRGRGLGIAVSIDDQPLQIMNVFGNNSKETMSDDNPSNPSSSEGYFKTITDNARVMRFSQTVATPGRHTLKISMVDPTVVIMKVIIHDSPLHPSYFGPPESPCHDQTL